MTKLKMKFTTRAYNSFSINKNHNSTLFKISNEKKLLDEIKYFENLPEELSIYFPRYIQNGSSLKKPYRLEIEYYAYSNLGSEMLNEKFNFDNWNSIFEFIFNYIENYKLCKSVPSNKTELKKMLIDKTYSEYKKLLIQNKFFDKFSKYEYIYFNDKKLLNFEKIWDKISEFILRTNFGKKFYYIHGDLCFSNILYSKNKYNNDIILKFIDPRGKFGDKYFYGDIYYDLAKLSHSVNGGYEYLIYDKFKMKLNKNRLLLDYENNNKVEIYNVLLSKFENYNYNLEVIKLIEGLIYIGMCARHYDSLSRQKAMYSIGLKLLNEVYEQI